MVSTGCWDPGTVVGSCVADPTVTVDLQAPEEILLASAHVAGWIANLGLTADQVIHIARESREQAPEPPLGPKALDVRMKQAATALRARFL